MKKHKKHKVQIDQFHLHEMMYGLHVLMDTIEDHLISHPVCDEYKEIRSEIVEAQSKLVNAYQLTGKIEFNDFEQNGIIKQLT